VGDVDAVRSGKGVPGFELIPVTPQQLRNLAMGRPVMLSRGPSISWPQDDRRMLTYRLEALRAAPTSWRFLLHAVLSADGVLLGRVGCHGGPDENHEVEIGYYVSRAWRGRGVAGAIVDAFLVWLCDQGVRRVRATVGPDNAASRRILERRCFRHVGEQWDDEDGLELVYLRDLS
jgi:RimJ/RimL family protein N-acetyltransferase